MAQYRAAIWARVSTTQQETENQVAQLRAAAERRGVEVVEVYRVEESAFTGKHRFAIDRVLNDARAGRFSVLLVWALDRLERRGVLATLQMWDRFTRAGVQVVSYQEPWTEVAGEIRELLLAITCVRRRKRTTRFGIGGPVISAETDHPFRRKWTTLRLSAGRG